MKFSMGQQQFHLQGERERGLRLIGEHQLIKLLLEQHQLASLHLLETTDTNVEGPLYELRVANEEAKWCALQQLLAKYGKVFEEPKGLPLERF